METDLRRSMKETIMIGNKLKVARSASGLSLRALAETMDGVVSAQAIGKYERNEDMPSSRVLIALAKAKPGTINFGSSGIGTMAIQLAKAFGSKVIVTVGEVHGKDVDTWMGITAKASVELRRD